MPVGPARVPDLPPDLVLRTLHWEDYEPLTKIYYELYDERAEGAPIGIHLFRDRPSKGDEVDWFSRLFRRVLSEEEVVVIAEVGGRAVGNCTVGPAGPLRQSETGHVGLLGILVDRRYRGRGVGTALLVRCLEECRGKFEQVRLSVASSNPEARRIYERVGFEPCGLFPRAIKRGGQYVDEEWMNLDLSRWSPPSESRKH